MWTALQRGTAVRRGANEILGMWSLSLYLAENGAITANADVHFPSWIPATSSAGMNTDYPQVDDFPQPIPSFHRRFAGDFTIDNAGPWRLVFAYD